jgi:hypothetical protein
MAKAFHETHKQCRRCLHFLPIASFAERKRRGERHYSGALHRLPWCRDCKRDYDREAVARKRRVAKKIVRALLSPPATREGE